MKKNFTILHTLKQKFLDFINFIASYGKSVKDGYKTNAFSPLVWFLVFIIPVLIGLIVIINNDSVRWILVGLIILLILFALLMYFLLFKKDPKLLQSEWYRLEDKKLEMMAAKGEDVKLIDAESIIKGIVGGETDV